MARFIRNSAGAIHSVPDDFDLDTINASLAQDEKPWADVAEEIAKAEHAHLFGEPDPAVESVRAHDGAGNPVEFDVLGNPDHVTNPPVADTPSTAPTGDPDTRVIEPTPAPKPVKADKTPEVTA